MIIKTWQERTVACAAQRHHDFYTCMMQAEIDELRSALAAKLVPMPDDEIVTIAHRTASTYAHRSDPTTHSYGFMKHTLVDFVRKIEAHHARKQEPTDWSAA